MQAKPENPTFIVDDNVAEPATSNISKKEKRKAKAQFVFGNLSTESCYEDTSDEYFKRQIRALL